MRNDELVKKVKGLELVIKSLTERTGCPKGFMPKYKLTKKLKVSEGLIDLAINQHPRMSKRVYGTESGGHIINCVGYNINSMRKAIKAVKKQSKKIGKVMMKHNKTGKVFKVVK